MSAMRSAFAVIPAQAGIHSHRQRGHRTGDDYGSALSRGRPEHRERLSARDDTATLGEALAEFRRANGLSADEAARASWTCRLGPLRLRLPNFQWRRRAILAHDLHHVLTGYPCTMRGEFQMAAWEFGAGPMPHWCAALFCLPLVLVGLVWSPRRIAEAFRAGRRCRSLHGSRAIDALLVMPLEAASALLRRVDKPTHR